MQYVSKTVYTSLKYPRMKATYLSHCETGFLILIPLFVRDAFIHDLHHSINVGRGSEFLKKSCYER